MKPERLGTGWLALLLVAVTLAVHGRTVGFGFVFDDHDYVLRNPLLAGGLSWESVRAAFTTDHSANWHPLTWCSHLVDVELFGHDPAGHHAVNVALHALNAVLVLVTIGALLGDRGVALVVALVFAVHPLRVESVAWVSERKDLLSGTFFLATLLAWKRFDEHGGPARYLMALGCFALGALAKPMIVTLPFVLLVLDAWPLGRWRRRGTARVVLEKLPFLALAALLVLATVRAQDAFGSIQALERFPLHVRAWNALAAISFYVEKALWPVELTALYPHPALTESDPVAALRPRAVAGALVLGAWLALGLALRRRRPVVLVSLLLFGGMLVPVIGVVQVGLQSWADRYAYLPLLWGSLVVVVPLASLARERPALRPLLRAAVVLVCLGLALRAFDQTATWRDERTLWTQALEHTTRNPTAHTNLAFHLLEVEEDLRGAADHARAALALDPGSFQAHQILAITLEREGDPAAALGHARAAARAAHVELVNLLFLARLEARLERDEDAERTYRRVLAVEPANGDALYGLGVLASRRGDLAAAERRYREVLAVDPDAHDARVNLADVLLRTGRGAEAAPLLAAAVAAAPDDPAIGANPAVLEALAAACASAGDRPGALRWQRRAVELFAGRPRQQRRATETLERYRRGP